MPLRFVSVEKKTLFQGRDEVWSNVYCYDMPNVNVSDHEAIQTAVANAEKPLYPSSVTIVRTRVFTTEGLNPFDDGDMYSVMERSESGTGGDGSFMPYKECAVLVKWPLPRRVKLSGGLGRQRSLKKWLRAVSAQNFTSATVTGQSPIPAAAQTVYTNYAAAVRTPTGGKLVTPSDGSEPSGTAIIHPYLEHRQFPRGRKEGGLLG